MSKIGIYPGTFDPMTNGHLNIIQRSLKVVDKLIIGVADNLNKKPLLSIEERKNIIANDIYFLKQNNKKTILSPVINIIIVLVVIKRINLNILFLSLKKLYKK